MHVRRRLFARAFFFIFALAADTLEGISDVINFHAHTTTCRTTVFFHVSSCVGALSSPLALSAFGRHAATGLCSPLLCSPVENEFICSAAIHKNKLLLHISKAGRRQNEGEGGAKGASLLYFQRDYELLWRIKFLEDILWFILTLLFLSLLSQRRTSAPPTKQIK